MSPFAHWMARHPIIPLAANLLVTLLLGWFALQIRVESSLSSVLPEGDPAIAYYAKVRETFGSDDVAVIGVRADDIFADSTLAKIERVTDASRQVKGVAQRPQHHQRRPIRPRTSSIRRAFSRTFRRARRSSRSLKEKLKTIPLYGKNLVVGRLQGRGDQRLLQELDRRRVLRPEHRPQHSRDSRRRARARRRSTSRARRT